MPRLRRFAYALTGNACDADDLVQIALERALRRADDRFHGGDIASWLFKIMQNAFIDQKRAAARRPAHVDLDDVAAETPAPGPDAAAGYADVMAAINALPEPQRLVVAHVLVDGRTYQETAGLLDVPVGTVMSRLSRARRTLMAALSPDSDAEAGAGAA